MCRESSRAPAGSLEPSAGFGPSPGGAGVAPGWLDRKVSFTEIIAKMGYINPSMLATEQDI